MINDLLLDPTLRTILKLEARHFFGLPSNPDLRDNERFIPCTQTDDFDTTAAVNMVIKSWQNVFNQLKHFPGNTKSDYRFYINSVLTSLPAFDDIHLSCDCPAKAVKLYELGYVFDYAYLNERKYLLDNPVLLIEIDHMGTVDAARIQLYRHLRSQVRDRCQLPIYGAMTTVSKWIFVRFDGTQFVESHSFEIDSFKDRVGLDTILFYLYHILHAK